ncbi:MAG: DUF996 domain-containing protein [Candidatus Methanoperedens sp.]|nr:DUF996 domain-containing protein [Candidatus Methanoperedens sp.]
MSSLAQAKTLGEIGSILMLLTLIPYAGGAIRLVGLVLVLVSVKYISDALADKSIFKNMLISVILAIVGLIIGVIFAAAVFFSFYRGFTGPFEPSIFMHPRFFTFVTAFFLAIIPIWIFFIISAVFLKKSYDTIASKLNISMFRTSALLYLVGAVLVIVLVGFIIIFIAEILQAVAFFSMPEQMPQPSQPAVQPV